MNNGPGRPLSVCVVEDEQRLRDLLVREISAMGHVVEGHRTAEDAWPALRAGRFRVVLLDLNLPGMSGMELFERVREAELDVAVVVLTGFGTLESAVQALRWEADDYLTKPCTLAEIEAVLARVDLHQQLLQIAAAPAATASPSTANADPPASTAAGQTLEDLEREQILAALRQHAGNKTAAARGLGISLRTLYNKLGVYRLQGYL